MTETHVSDVEYMERWTVGGSQTASKAPGRAGPLGGFPATLDRASGALVFDADGRSYVDWVSSLAAVALGHCYGPVVEAVERRLRTGSLLSLPLRLEGEASEALCRVTGWADQARWVKTGSEACQASVRIARKATGRGLVATVGGGYHGWLDWFQAVKPEHPGVPDVMSDLVVPFAYGDIPDPSVLKQCAALILEGVQITGLPDGWSQDTVGAYLRQLQQACRDAGALLILDEIVWGFRLAPGGVSEWVGVEPDLAVYGKALGNGIPVSAVVGRRHVMSEADVVSGTFGGDGLGLAAAVAVIAAHTASPVCRDIATIGTALQSGFNQLAPRTLGQRPVSLTLIGLPQHPVPRMIVDQSLVSPAEAMSLFLQELAARGVLWHPGGLNPSFAHDASHVATTLTAAESALATLAASWDSGRVRADLRGTPYAAAFARRTA